MIDAVAHAGRLRPRGHRSRLRSWLAPTYEIHQQRAIGPAVSVLDVGCGANSPLGRFDVRYPFSLGVDVYAPAVEESSAAGIHDGYLVCDVLELAERIEPRSFDAVVAFDLIEHLTRAQGETLLAMMERVARRRVVVFTPNGFLPQESRDGNPFQVHRSGWSAEAFRSLGYTVRGVNGLRALRGERGSMRWRPSRFWGVVSDLTQPLVARRPSLAFHLLCVKEVGRAVPPR